MIEQNVLDDEEIRIKKINFWSTWTLANSVGAAIGWGLGYILDMALHNLFDTTSGSLAAGLIFEGSIWFFRLIVIRHFKEFNPLRKLDIMVWMINEAFVWSIFQAMGQKETPGLTLGEIFSQVWAAGFWITFSFIARSPKDNKHLSKWWFVSSFFMGLFGFIGGSMLLSIVAVVSMEIGETIEKVNLAVGWGSAGLALGGAIGAITGLAFIKLMSWNPKLVPLRQNGHKDLIERR